MIFIQLHHLLKRFLTENLYKDDSIFIKNESEFEQQPEDDLEINHELAKERIVRLLKMFDCYKEQ